VYQHLVNKRVQDFIDILLKAPAIFTKSEVSKQGVLSEFAEGERAGGESVVNPAKRESIWNL